MLEGALGLPGGTWFFGYHADEKTISASWAGSSLNMFEESSEVTLRVWSLGSTIRSPDRQSRKVLCIVEKQINLYNPSIQEKIEASLDKYLVFEVEGTGPAVGESVSVRIRSQLGE